MIFAMEIYSYLYVKQHETSFTVVYNAFLQVMKRTVLIDSSCVMLDLYFYNGSLQKGLIIVRRKDCTEGERRES